MKALCACSVPGCRAYGLILLTVRHHRYGDLSATWRLCFPHALAELRRHAGGAWSVHAHTVTAG